MSFPGNANSKALNELDYGTSSAALFDGVNGNGRPQWKIRSAIDANDNCDLYSSRDCRYIVAPARRYYEESISKFPIDYTESLLAEYRNIIVPVDTLLSEFREERKSRPKRNDLLQAVPNPGNNEELKIFYTAQDNQTLCADAINFDKFHFSSKISLTRPLLKISHSSNNENCLALMTSTDLSIVFIDKLLSTRKCDVMIKSQYMLPNLPSDVIWNTSIMNEGNVLFEDGSICNWTLNRNLDMELIKVGEEDGLGWQFLINCSHPKAVIRTNEKEACRVDIRSSSKSTLSRVKDKNNWITAALSLDPLTCYHFAVATTKHLNIYDERFADRPVLSWPMHYMKPFDRLKYIPAIPGRLFCMSDSSPNVFSFWFSNLSSSSPIGCSFPSFAESQLDNYLKVHPASKSISITDFPFNIEKLGISGRDLVFWENQDLLQFCLLENGGVVYENFSKYSDRSPMFQLTVSQEECGPLNFSYESSDVHELFEDIKNAANNEQTQELRQAEFEAPYLNQEFAFSVDNGHFLMTKYEYNDLMMNGTREIQSDFIIPELIMNRLSIPRSKEIVENSCCLISSTVLDVEITPTRFRHEWLSKRYSDEDAELSDFAETLASRWDQPFGLNLNTQERVKTAEIVMERRPEEAPITTTSTQPEPIFTNVVKQDSEQDTATPTKKPKKKARAGFG